MPATPADHEACRAAIRAGSKSFFAASLLLPERVRRPALALYAFCRLADDAVDVVGGTRSLEVLRERLARIYAGDPADYAADRALADVIAQHAIPRHLPEALLEGFQWDLEGRRYESLDELKAYAARVAGTVGEMMSCIMDTRSPEALKYACDLGIAMQLTNIARDVGEDARAGRLYLPLNWLRQRGLQHSIEQLLEEADTLYEHADRGIPLLPPDCRAAISAARHLYAEIGHQLQRQGCHSPQRRTVVPVWRKLLIVAATLLDERARWLFELFERLERRDREGVSPAPGAS